MSDNYPSIFLHGSEIIFESAPMSLTPEQHRVLPEDVRLLIEKGYLQGDLRLTDQGKEALMDIIYRMHKQVLVDLAREEKEKPF